MNAGGTQANAQELRNCIVLMVNGRYFRSIKSAADGAPFQRVIALPDDQVERQRFAARKYLEHVALRKIRFGELNRQFLRNHFLPRLASLATSKTNTKERCAIVDEILNASDGRFARVNEDLVNTKANLSFEVFADICLVCGVPTFSFADRADFVDVLLLKRRNAVAHGEETFVGIEDLDQVATRLSRSCACLAMHWRTMFT